jgi:hypothetical protein
MKESSRNLYPSLVGGSIEFRMKSAVTPMDGSIRMTRKRIAEHIASAFSVGGKVCILLLGELTSFYTKESYYLAVRGSIEMRRYRPAVLEYLQKSVEERADLLHQLFTESSKSHKNREFHLIILRYFISVYSGRLSEFKKYLSKEEFLIVGA